MASYSQIRDVAVNKETIGRLAVALVDAAITVLTENEATPNHTNRAAFAKNVVMNPPYYAEHMIWAIALKVTGTTDNDLKAACLLVWNGFSGIEVA